MASHQRHRLCFVRSKSSPKTAIEHLPVSRTSKRQHESKKESLQFKATNYQQQSKQTHSSMGPKDASQRSHRAIDGVDDMNRMDMPNQTNHYIHDDFTRNLPYSCRPPIDQGRYLIVDPSLRTYHDAQRTTDQRQPQGFIVPETRHQMRPVWPKMTPTNCPSLSQQLAGRLDPGYDQTIGAEWPLPSNGHGINIHADHLRVSRTTRTPRTPNLHRSLGVKRHRAGGKRNIFQAGPLSFYHQPMADDAEVDYVSSSLGYLDITSSDDSDSPIPERKHKPYHYQYHRSKHHQPGSQDPEVRFQNTDSSVPRPGSSLTAGKSAALHPTDPSTFTHIFDSKSSSAISSTSYTLSLSPPPPEYASPTSSSTLLPPLSLSEAYDSVQNSARAALSILKPLLKSFDDDTKALKGYTGMEILDEIWRGKIRRLGRMRLEEPSYHHRDDNANGAHTGRAEVEVDDQSGGRTQDQEHNQDEYNYDNDHNSSDNKEARNTNDYNNNDQSYNAYYNDHLDQAHSTHTPSTKSQIRSSSSSSSPNSSTQLKNTVRVLQQSLHSLYESCHDALTCRIPSSHTHSHPSNHYSYPYPDDYNPDDANYPPSYTHKRDNLNTICLHNQISPFLDRIKNKLLTPSSPSSSSSSAQRRDTTATATASLSTSSRRTKPERKLASAAAAAAPAAVIGEIILQRPDEARRIVWELEGLMFLVGRAVGTIGWRCH